MDTKKLLEKARNYASGQAISIREIERAVDAYLQATDSQKYELEKALRYVRKRAIDVSDDKMLQIFADRNLVEKLTTIGLVERKR